MAELDNYTLEWRRQHAERLKQHLDQAHQRCIVAADLFARRFLPMLLKMQQHGMGLREIAAEMNARGYTSRRDGPWTDQTIRQMLKRRPHLIIAEVFNEPPRSGFVGWQRRGYVPR
jgi:hypothetical protein